MATGAHAETTPVSDRAACAGRLDPTARKPAARPTSYTRRHRAVVAIVGAAVGLLGVLVPLLLAQGRRVDALAIALAADPHRTSVRRTVLVC